MIVWEGDFPGEWEKWWGGAARVAGEDAWAQAVRVAGVLAEAGVRRVEERCGCVISVFRACESDLPGAMMRRRDRAHAMLYVRKLDLAFAWHEGVLKYREGERLEKLQRAVKGLRGE